MNLLLQAAWIVSSTVGIPLEWVEYDGHEYASVIVTLTWEEARVEAEAHGATLVVINTPEEEQFLRQQFVLPYWTDFWIGAEQDVDGTEPDGGWHWINGDPWSYTNWDATQPDNNNSANVAVIGPSTTGWADSDGVTPYYALFERGVPTVPAASSWGVGVMALLLAVAASLAFRPAAARGATDSR